jgi:outer membrane protein
MRTLPSTPNAPPDTQFYSLMNLFRHLLIALLALAPLTLQAEKSPIATVNMQKLFKEYHVAIAQRGSIESLKERIKDDPRIKKIADLTKGLKGLKALIEDPATSEPRKEELFKEFQAKGGELKSIQRDAKQHIEAEQAKINAQFVEMTRSLLADIQKAVAIVAEKAGYELVLESEGHTSSQLPTLLYIRHGDDITDVVLKHLNKGQGALGVTPSGTR